MNVETRKKIETTRLVTFKASEVLALLLERVPEAIRPVPVRKYDVRIEANGIEIEADDDIELSWTRTEVE